MTPSTRDAPAVALAESLIQEHDAVIGRVLVRKVREAVERPPWTLQGRTIIRHNGAAQVQLQPRQLAGSKENERRRTIFAST